MISRKNVNFESIKVRKSIKKDAEFKLKLYEVP